MCLLWFFICAVEGYVVLCVVTPAGEGVFFYPIYSVFSMLSTVFSVCLHKNQDCLLPLSSFLLLLSLLFSSSTSPKEEIKNT